MKAYMLSFTSKSGNLTRQNILDYLDTRSEVLNWYAVMPFTIILVSAQTQSTLTELLRLRFGNEITFLLAKVESNTINGFINEQVWNFINNPKSSGRWNN